MLHQALLPPVSGGRRVCPPLLPVSGGRHVSSSAAIMHLPQIWRLSQEFRFKPLYKPCCVFQTTWLTTQIVPAKPGCPLQQHPAAFSPLWEVLASCPSQFPKPHVLTEHPECGQCNQETGFFSFYFILNNSDTHMTPAVPVVESGSVDAGHKEDQ